MSHLQLSNTMKDQKVKRMKIFENAIVFELCCYRKLVETNLVGIEWPFRAKIHVLFQLPFISLFFSSVRDRRGENSIPKSISAV